MRIREASTSTVPGMMRMRAEAAGLALRCGFGRDDVDSIFPSAPSEKRCGMLLKALKWHRGGRQQILLGQEGRPPARKLF